MSITPAFAVVEDLSSSVLEMSKWTAKTVKTNQENNNEYAF